jgi:hypothetical protein
VTALAALVVAAGAWGGCGGSDNKTTSTSASPTALEQSRRHAQERRLAHRIAELRHKIARERRARRRAKRATAATGASTGTIAGFHAFAQGLSGQVGAVIGSPDGSSVETGGGLRSGSAWSTIKVPISAQVIADAGGPDGLSSSQRSLIDRAITQSDNSAAASLWSELESRHGGTRGAADAVGKLLHEAGDDETQVSTQGRDGFSPYGQTEWSLVSQHRFMTSLAGGCVVSRAASRYLLDTMSHVTSDTWGLGSAGVPALWKGGWGPGRGGYLVRQMGELKRGGGDVVITIAAEASRGSFEAGQQMASQTARWLAQHSSDVAGSGSPC